MGDPFGSRTIGSVANHQQARRQLADDLREDANHIARALDRPKIGQVHQDLLARLRVASAPRRALRLAQWHVNIAVHEIGNDVDRPQRMEFLDRLVPQVSGNGGHAIALIDAEAGNGQIRVVESHQRNICPVQRCNEG